ncbi:GNAT family N-acetyltransferase [Staphylococcus hyicus]|uniref:GNAT family N-acetyltransferase n=1 Tax=Staphylococcus hyicus TaxID=1284 RepID=UPI00273889C2|nr:GNAT family N-acetyltransferase [Staphylococcus hyicus]MDP4447540.1 GNAT family N-acetyltransferase [Staphylococcus hyicus]MDP4460448.1 GNAT family N-acetyltransferase [Staphylococcus hyicus]MDY3697741.1 GNAT family N-acetyltransferase [Staphylococcus hyicus]
MIKKVESEKEYQDVLSIRMTVFVDEQNVPKEEEIDEFEHISTHFIAYDDNGMALATARYRIVDSIVKVERVAVLKDARGLGVGKQLMLFLENDALQQGYTQFKLGAQTHAISFYEALGYTAYGDQFLDAGIPHYFMKKQVRL